jgi:multimeric flavodoxin WrbA/protein-tyrosine-phosphatase
MFVIGLQGSPRLKGNTSILLSAFMDEAERLGANAHCIHASRVKVSPCVECGNCEEKGFCAIDDDMQNIFTMLRRADVIVMATPIFFYGPTAQLKALIDRTQTLWARKYVHKLVDPGRKWRIGLLFSVGATRGQNLFDGVELTAKYFFDAVGASFGGSLLYRKVEKAGEIANHSTALEDARAMAKKVVRPFLNRKKVLFVSTEDACRSQMASAFMQYYAGDRIEVESGGSAPAEQINPVMEQVMAEKGIDVAYRKPKPIEDAVRYGAPEMVISTGGEEASLHFPGVTKRKWAVPDPAGKPIDFMCGIRDEVEGNVRRLIEEIGG